MKPRVVITGLGAVTPLANSMVETWNGLLAGKSGVAPVRDIDTEGLATTIAAQVKDLDAEPFIDKKMLRRLDPSEVFCLVASQMAIDDSGIDLEKVDKERCGVVTGSGIGGIQTLEAQHRTMMDRGAGKVSPFFVPMMIIDMCAGMTAMRFGFRGPNYSTVSACASSAHALADAFRIIQRGEADLMLSGGAEAAITKLSMAGFCAARA